jgi:hypothetical protein
VPTWVPLGSGCIGSNGVPVLQLVSLPAIGGTFSLGVQNLASSYAYMVTGFGLLPRALPLNWGFATGCTLQVDASVLVQFLPQAAGLATWSLAIPNLPALAGMHLYNQVVEFGAVSAVSNAGNGEIH